MNRRQLLTRIGSLAALSLTTQAKSPAQSTTTTLPTSTPPHQPITIAHITDIHMTPELHAQKWFTQCLHHIQSHPAKPQFILNSGDSVYETLKENRTKTDQLWALWNQVIQQENTLPIYHVLGNHDIWAWGIKDQPTLKAEPSYGKKLGMDALSLTKPYYSFDHGPWHFIALDSCKPDADSNGGWIAELDDEQFAWLKKDIQQTPTTTPILIYSHLPIIQVASHRVMEPYKGWYRFSPWSMHRDARKFLDLFAQHPNVKLCLSGHLHLQDRIELSGVTYMCAGAVCGNWWKGTHIDCGPGYTLLTLNPDGTFHHQYTSYNWKPHETT